MSERVLGTPPPRGGWLRLPAWMIAVGVPVFIGIGWAIPELGVTLIAFLIVDLVLGAIRKRSASKAVPVSPVPASN